mmetsp:Transcript_39634/g.55043  ORF Transcript_39634/g.55043 Transcript_39634/m.55043 type:complete len:326 (+) Transcript_39634:102-1079(+)|eukprot:CAMPEP_0196579464 /NCGR_PEP_ID=MMETSP1081-20130531/22016_1 /TAXON_ID=36882 /ORGANISM="Pyramimonas amylifera, Strain CCMP720" /LENGTH=325 /DNA_ID=CAMNT_0041899067 /DNA_START=95 /DNA_END=1072 /DNA_ORIENTATION=-
MSASLMKGIRFATTTSVCQHTSVSTSVAAKLSSKSETRAFVKGCASWSVTKNLHTGRGRLIIANTGFDPESFQVLGIPGVEISGPETQFDGPGGAIIPGRFDENGNALDLSEDEDEVPLELAWDPDGVMKDSTPGADDLISKNMAAREEAFEKEREEKEAEEKKKAREELQAYRDARVMPSDDPTAMLSYLLDTEINELEFEVTRCRPQLTPEFFSGAELAAAESSSERAAEITEMLRATRQLVAFMDGNVAALAAPADRLRDLLQAPNKRDKIAEMAGEGQIDQQLLALLFTNMQMAKEAGTEDSEKAAEFMGKLYEACKKFSA